MYCVLCGTQNPDYGRYCLQCGKPLERKAKPVSGKAHPRPVSSGPLGAAQAPTPLGRPATARLEIRPKTGRNGLFLIVGCALFTFAGFAMVNSGEAENIAGGLLAIVFFGGGGLIMIPKLLRRKTSMVLSEQGIGQITPYGTAFISWRDVERLGTVSQFGSRFVGIRLNNYDRYVESMSPEMTAFMSKSLPYMRLLARATALLPTTYAVELWSKLKGEPDTKDALKSFGKTGSYVEALLWSREQYGYDILIGWADRDRGASRFLELLERYRALSEP